MAAYFLSIIMLLPVIAQFILMGYRLAKRISLKLITITALMMALTILTTTLAVQIHLATIDHSKKHYGPPDVGLGIIFGGLFLGIIVLPVIGLFGGIFWHFDNKKPKRHQHPYQNY